MGDFPLENKRGNLLEHILVDIISKQTFFNPVKLFVSLAFVCVCVCVCVYVCVLNISTDVFVLFAFHRMIVEYYIVLTQSNLLPAYFM